MRDTRYQSLGISISELAGARAEAVVVFLEKLSDLGLQRVIRVRVLEQGYQAFDDELGVEGGHPAVLDGLRADLACVLLNVRMEYLSLEQGLGRLERVIVTKIDVYHELAARVGRVRRADDGHVPVGQGVPDERDRHALDRLVVVQVCQFLKGRLSEGRCVLC